MIKPFLNQSFDKVYSWVKRWDISVNLVPALSLYEIEEILINCNYSNAFIKNANDLQILEAISECYNEYRVLNL